MFGAEDVTIHCRAGALRFLKSSGHSCCLGQPTIRSASVDSADGSVSQLGTVHPQNIPQHFWFIKALKTSGNFGKLGKTITKKPHGKPHGSNDDEIRWLPGEVTALVGTSGSGKRLGLYTYNII